MHSRSAAAGRRDDAPPGKGVRTLRLEDQLPDCPIYINRPIYALEEIAKGRRVLDIGCGYGRNRSIVEGVGGEWVGVEPFEGGAHTVVASADALPFEDASFDLVVMDAVLEHLEDVPGAFSETARVLRPGGAFVGYVAFMECFHEISYSHLSYMALQSFARSHCMVLEAVGGGHRFGIDYHLAVLVHPLPLDPLRGLVAGSIRGVFRIKSFLAYLALRARRRLDHASAADKARKYYSLECLRQSVGFTYIIRKPGQSA